MNGLDYRLKEFLPLPERHTVILDASAGLSLGTLPGLEDFHTALQPLLPHLDGLVCSPGQLRRMGNRTRADAALLVRGDWTNTLRSQTFPLPPETATHATLLNAEDALELGATAMVVSFLLGYEEAIEADCLKSMVQLALAGKQLSLPVIVEVLPSGPRISLPGKAVELGASFALEGGADVIVVPYPGKESLFTIGAMLSVPWLLKPGSAENAGSEWSEALDLGASGLWLDHAWLNSTSRLMAITGLVHQAHKEAG